MTRAEKEARAREMRTGGAKLREIASALGYKNPHSAWKLLNPERHRQQEAVYNKRRHQAKLEHQRQVDRSPRGRAICPRCGELMGVGSARRVSTGKNCSSCARRRRERIVELWNQGATLKEIAADLGTTNRTIGVEIHRLRERGENLPYRRPPRNVPPAFPDQVAA